MTKQSNSIFEPCARLMLLLGDELIRDAGIAVFELVKNAYDADATKCSVILENVHPDSENARVVIEDDGHGMDVETIKNIWLSPGTRHRLKQRNNPDVSISRTKKYHRLPLGEKGVGRFAVHKLGDNVKLITRASHSKEVVVSIDWKTFDSDKPLRTVPVDVHTREPELFRGNRHGTRIEISNLREKYWIRSRVRALHRAVTSVCSPIEGPDSFEATLELSPDKGKWLSGMLTPGDVRNMALFEFSGTIHTDHLVYNYSFRPTAKMKRVQGREISGKEIPFPKPSARSNSSPEEDERIIGFNGLHIGEVQVDFSIFDRERKTLMLMPGDSKELTSFLDQNGGVRVYRDGVRIYDFGEPGNDWLELGGRRVNVPTKRIGNNQIIGTVRLNLNESQNLVEKTNREGFVENQAYMMFRRAVKFALSQAESERNKDKQRIRIAYSQAREKEPVLADLQALRDEIDHFHLSKEQSKKAKRYIDQIDIQYREVLDRLLTAAGAGLNLALVLHEVEKTIQSLYSAVEHGETISQILERAKNLANLVDSLTWLTRQSGKSTVEAAEFIKQCLFAWSFRFQRHNVSVTNGFDQKDPPFSIKCNRRLIMTALMNLVDNSLYWLTTRSENRRLYLGTTFELTGNPALVVADNGPGLSDPPEYLTMPFFTRKPDGMGLGLHLADEIMKAQGGSLEFPTRGDVTLPSGFSGAVILLQFGKSE